VSATVIAIQLQQLCNWVDCVCSSGKKYFNFSRFWCSTHWL